MDEGSQHLAVTISHVKMVDLPERLKDGIHEASIP